MTLQHLLLCKYSQLSHIFYQIDTMTRLSVFYGNLSLLTWVRAIGKHRFYLLSSAVRLNGDVSLSRFCLSIYYELPSFLKETRCTGYNSKSVFMLFIISNIQIICINNYLSKYWSSFTKTHFYRSSISIFV